MGFLSAIGTGIGSFFGGPLGAVAGSAIGSGVDYLFGQSSAKQAQRASNKAMSRQQQFNKDNYQSRYQWTAKDMKSAGLNPILAATGGFSVGNAPSVSLPSMPMGTTGRFFPISSSAKEFQQSTTEKTKREQMRSQIKVNLRKTQEGLEHIYLMRKQKGLATATEKNIMKHLEYINVEMENLSSQTVLNTFSAAQKEFAARKDIEAAKKIIAETENIKALLPKLKAESHLYDTRIGQYMYNLKALRETFGINFGFGLGKIK